MPVPIDQFPLSLRLPRRPALARVLAVALGVSAGLQGASAGEPDVAEQRRRLEAVRSEIRTVLESLETTRQARSEAEQSLRKVELELNRQHRALREVRREAAASRKELEKLETRHGALERDLRVQREKLAGQLRAAYLSGNQEHLKLVLEQQDPSVLARTLKYYEYLNRARLAVIGETEATLAELARTRSSIEREHARLARLAEREQVEYRRLAGARAERQALLERLGARITEHRRSVENLRRDETSIQELLASLTGMFADIPPQSTDTRAFAESRGSLPWPVEGAFLNRFGEPRAGSDLVWHGVRIAAPRGREVRAVSHGRVAFADWLPGFGLILIVDHGNGYMSLYGHNEALYKETGDWVRPRETIASTGASGGAEQSALYFEIRHNGKPVDPARWCLPLKG